MVQNVIPVVLPRQQQNDEDPITMQGSKLGKNSRSQLAPRYFFSRSQHIYLGAIWFIKLIFRGRNATDAFQDR